MNPQINLANSALLTDLYQLTMLQGYHDAGMEDVAVFEFFVRKLRPGRGFLMAAGLEQSLEFLEGLHFSSEELAWLATTRRFSNDFLAGLETLRFTGDVHAMPEGTIFFPKAYPARDRADRSGATGRNAADQPAALPDADRLQGGAHGTDGA